MPPHGGLGGISPPSSSRHMSNPRLQVAYVHREREKSSASAFWRNFSASRLAAHMPEKLSPQAGTISIDRMISSTAQTMKA